MDRQRARPLDTPPPDRLLLEYKGYIGEVSHDDEADVLHARVVNSGAYPIANAEAVDAASLEQEFRRSIDVYLKGCEELQIDPISSAPGAASSRQSEQGTNWLRLTAEPMTMPCAAGRGIESHTAFWFE